MNKQEAKPTMAQWHMPCASRRNKQVKSSWVLSKQSFLSSGFQRIRRRAIEPTKIENEGYQFERRK